MQKTRSFLSILVPSATVFITSFCIMVLELVASRLIARHLGSSLYTWTAVIGVVLAGITIGNYLGGRIADRFQAQKTLAVLFMLSSAACVVTVIMNNLVGDWLWLWQFSWPVRIFTHVSLVFLLPSLLLGTVGPVVAKMALDRGLATGRTVGNIYAWSAAGSIVGTFVAGYYLIAAMGTVAIIWTVGGMLLLMALLYWVRFWLLYSWLLVFIAGAAMGMAPADWAKSSGSSLGLREKPNPYVLYEDESQYCYIRVKRLSEQPDERVFVEDKLVHSQMIMGDILNLQYDYEQIHAAVTHRLSKDKKNLAVLVIGGGGYVFPRYIDKVWPGSRVDVAEIDPGVTKAAVQAFGLEPDTRINTISMDARNYVDELLYQKSSNGKAIRYDFIYEDAVNDYTVPYQLTTKEFNNKFVNLLADDGVYMVELIDVLDDGLFLGAFVNTLEKTFPYVYVISDAQLPRDERNTFVVVAAKRQLNLKNLEQEYDRKKLNLLLLSESDIELLRQKTHGLVLTDDYAPVENLLAPVVRRSAAAFLFEKYFQMAEELKAKGQLDETIVYYRKLKKAVPSMTIQMCNDIGLILAGQGKLEEAVKSFREALAYNERSKKKDNMANIYCSLGVALQRLGRNEEASREFALAIERYQKQLSEEPNSIKTLIRLGDTLATNSNFAEATSYFQRAVNLDPMILGNHFKLIQSLEFAGQLEQAIEATKNAIKIFSRNNQQEATATLSKYLEQLELKKM
jgi:tetratricopeptide (TPR) repeat protein